MTGEAALEDLLARCGVGDRAAFAALYRRTSAKLHGICLRILVDRGEAEDALQEAYVKIWRNAARYSCTRARPITWMAAIARNQAIDRYRARRPVTVDLELAADAADPGRSPEEAAAQSAERRRLEACLDRLERRHAAAIRAAYMGGHTYEALARAADVPLGTMKSWIRRGLIQLRACLE